jgi:hypothetical protein
MNAPGTCSIVTTTARASRIPPSAVILGGTPYCGDGTCQQSPCNSQTELCAPNSICCGNICCPVGDICCQDQGPISVAPNCHTPTMAAPTCPQGCAPLCKSDRNQKKNIAPANTDAILRKVGELPISTWTYLSEPSTVRHLGPMAQDFHASFGLGDDEKLERENRVLGQRLRALDSPHQLTSKERRK